MSGESLQPAPQMLGPGVGPFFLFFGLGFPDYPLETKKGALFIPTPSRMHPKRSLTPPKMPGMFKLQGGYDEGVCLEQVPLVSSREGRTAGGRGGGGGFRVEG